LRVALAITSHERPDALGAVLASVLRQRVKPDEIVVADDGSGAATYKVIEDFLVKSPAPARLVSQPHEGFRVARLRNLAIAAITSGYIVFVDGDMLLHSEFIADHLRIARPGRYTQGVRVLADEGLTRALISREGRWPSPAARGLGLLRRAYLLHSPAISALSGRIGNGLVAVKSCNQGFWRDDLVRVNGFNEDMIGWGPEDKELCARVEHAGVHRQSLLFGGIACHLHHPAASREALPANLAILEATRRSGTVRCEHGLDRHWRA
jgi:glycosyltransferase involved in cell wall biosynthesis